LFCPASLLLKAVLLPAAVMSGPLLFSFSFFTCRHTQKKTPTAGEETKKTLLSFFLISFRFFSLNTLVFSRLHWLSFEISVIN